MANRFLSNIKINDSYTLPSADGTNGQIISTDGSGNLSFIDNASDNSRSIIFTVKNISGGNLTKGTVVHASPSATPPSGNVIEVIKADNDVSGSMPAIGVLNETLANEAEGDCVMMGAVSGIDTSAFSVGDELYVDSSPGAFTATKPTGTSNLIQKIGIVIKSHASNGRIEVFGAGRTNDVPNQINRDIQFSNDNKLSFGNDNDLRMYHVDGGDSIITKIGTGEGNLIIQNAVADQDVIFRGDNGAGSVTSYFRIDGSAEQTTFSKDTRHADNVKANFGSSDDLQIYHTADTASYIEQTNAHDLIITNTGAAELEIKSNRKVNIYIDQNNDDTTNSFNILSNVNTYAANDVIFEVTQTGNVNIDGNVVADGDGTFNELTLTGSTDNLTITESLNTGDWEIKNAQQDNALKIYDGTGGVELKYAGSAKFMADSTGVHTAANVDFYVDTNLIYADTTNDRVGIGKTAPDYKFEVNGKIASNNYIIAGLGNGGVALTHNDGYGNANLTFNHVSGIPEQDGSSGRIVVTTDSTTAKMSFELKDNVTQDTAVDTPMIMELYSGEVVSNVDTKVRANGGGILSIQRNDTSIIDGNPLGRLRFSGDDPTDGTFNKGAEIRGEAAGTWSTDNYPTELQFYTTTTNTDELALKLDSSQNATFRGDIRLEGQATNNIYMQSSTANTYLWNIIARSDDYFLIGRSGVRNDFYINPSGNATFAGNLGINVTSPSRRLHIDQDSTTAGGAYIYSNAIHTGTATNSLVSIRQDHASATGTVLDVRGDGTGDKLIVWDTSDVALIVKDGGNVGIGTDSPDTELHIAHNSDAGADGWLTIEDTDTTTGSQRPHIVFQGNGTEIGRIRVLDTTGMQFATGSSTSLAMTIDQSQRVGIGTTSPTQSKLVVDGTISIPRSEGFQYLESISGAFRAGIFSTNTNDAGVGFNSLRFFVNGDSTDAAMVIGGSTNTKNVGIGTTNPLRKLDLIVDATTHAARIKNTNSNGGGLSVFAANGGGGTNSILTLGDSSENIKVSVIENGNVGIGETSPAVPLHISKNSASGENIALLLDNNNTTVGNEIGMLFRSMAGSTNTDFEIFGKANAANDMDLVFQSDGSVERVRFTADGNVGIQASTIDDGDLQIGDSNSTFNIALAGPRAKFGYDGSNAIVQGGSSKGIAFCVNNNTLGSGEAMRIDSSGNVNIGTTGAASGSHKLVVESASTTGTVNSHIALIGDSATIGEGPQILFSEAGDGQAYAGGTIGFTRTGGNSQGALLFGTRGSSGDATTTTTERMRIDSSGLVGIGTSSPLVKLDVNGVLYSRGGTWNGGGSESNYTIVGFVIQEGHFIFTRDGSNLRKLIGKTNDIIEIGQSGTSLIDGVSFLSGTTPLYRWYSNASEIMRLDATGLGIGTTSPLEKLHVLYSDTAGIATVYSKGIIEDTDAQFDLLSSSDGSWGSAINFVESAGGNANTDVWSIARKTTGGAGDSSLNFNFGTNNQHNNTTRVVFSSTGDITSAAGDLTLSDGSVFITQSVGTETFKVTTPYDRVGKFISSDANAFLAIQDNGSTDNGVGINVTGDQMKLLTGNSAGLTVESDQQIRFNAYGSGTFTGTSAYNLAVDSSGNIIETSGNVIDGSGAAGRVAFWTDGDTLSSDSVFYYDDTNNRLGINVASPDHKLHVSTGNGDTTNTARIVHTRNDADVGTNALHIDANFSGTKTAATDTVQTGIFIDLDSSADGSSGDEVRSYGVYVDARFTGFNDLVRGVYGRVESNNTTEKTSEMIGVLGLATHDSSSTNGGVSNMYGAKGHVQIQDYGDVDNAYGLQGYVEIGNNRNANVDIIKAVEGQIQIDEATALTYGTMTVISAIIDNNEGSAPTFGLQYLFKGDYQGDKASGAYGIYCEGERHYLEGNVGIGTTAPDGNLEVVTTSTVSGASDSVNNVLIGLQAANRPTIILDTADTTYTNRTWNITNVGSAGSLFLGRNGLDVLVMKNDGKVGIKETNPASDLVVRSDNAGGRGGELSIVNYATNTVGNEAALNFGLEASTYNADFGNGQIKSRVMSSNAASDMIFSTWNGGSFGERLRIQAGGNIGITQSSPAAKLHVRIGGIGNSANDEVDGVIFEGDRHDLIFKQIRTANDSDWSSTTFRLQNRVDTTLMSSIDFVTATNFERHIDINTASNSFNTRFTHNGRVGIGTTAPNEKLEVNGSVKIGNMKLQNANGGRIGFNRNTADGSIYDSGYAAFQINGAYSGVNYLDFQAYNSSGNFQSQMVFTSSGKLGIGTTSPSTELHVDGTITTDARSSRDKIRVWSNGTYAIGMRNSMTYGAINNDYAMTFQMSNTANRGFWWGDSNHTDAQGAMSLSTTGVATIATSLSIGEGQSETSPQTDTLFVSGNARLSRSAGDAVLTIEADTDNNAENDNPRLELKQDAGGVYTHLGINGDANNTFTNAVANYGYLRGSVGLHFVVNGLAMSIDNSNRVGIGTNSPDARFQVVHSGVAQLIIGYNGNSQNFLDADTQYFRSGGGSTRMLLNGTGLGIGTSAPAYKLDVDTTFNDGIYLRCSGTGDAEWLFSSPSTNTFYIKDVNQNAERLRINTSGYLGVLETNPQYELDVDGDIHASGDVIAFSDISLKENIKTIDNSLEKVNKLRGVEFNKIGSDKKSIGVIAQEIEKILPEVVKENDEGIKSVAYGNITGILIEAIKELKQEIETLKTQINN